MQTADLQTRTWASQTSTWVSQTSTSVILFRLAFSDGNGKVIPYIICQSASLQSAYGVHRNSGYFCSNSIVFISTVGFSYEDNRCQSQGIGKSIKEKLLKGFFRVD